MLWRVEDFKGIASAQIDFRPGKKTILTGVNSSGKSSIIQSLLLVAQSLHSDTQLALNGPLVRLGDAQDLLRDNASRGAIRFTLAADASTAEEMIGSGDFSTSFDLVPSEDPSLLRARHVELKTEDDDNEPLVFGRENARKSDIDVAVDATRQLGSRDALHIKSLLGSERRQLRTYVTMQGIRPIAVVQVLKADQIYTSYKTFIESYLGDLGAVPKTTTRTRASASPIVREFIRLLLQAGKLDQQLHDAIESLKVARSGNPVAFQDAWERLTEKDRHNCIEFASRVRQRRPYAFIPIRGNAWGRSPVSGVLEGQLTERLGKSQTALNTLSDALDSVADRIQYLGPLRDEPRVVWNHWNELARGLPVGTRGEYSAAVLSRANARLITYAPPAGRAKSGPLGEAVNEWLSYLDIGEAVTARSHGKLGVGLDLKVGGQIRDLTSVGVGVSQALPLLVGLLTAPEDSMFIVEQPELHLHPAVQARLADFLLKARPDVALIVETHSDSFVTRIRRRSAEGTVAADSVDITFVEPSRTGSRARVLSLSEYGDLSEWPKGFLSSAEEDVRAIIKANIVTAKKIRPATRGSDA
jgi:predicted ATPase